MINAYGPDAYKAYCLGNELKYRLRAGFKGEIGEEIGKAMKYIEFRKEAAEESRKVQRSESCDCWQEEADILNDHFERTAAEGVKETLRWRQGGQEKTKQELKDVFNMSFDFPILTTEALVECLRKLVAASETSYTDEEPEHRQGLYQDRLKSKLLDLFERDSGPWSIAELGAELSGVRAQDMVEVLRQLRSEGLIERQLDGKWRRAAHTCRPSDMPYCEEAEVMSVRRDWGESHGSYQPNEEVDRSNPPR